ncbi:hypothetical protein [Methylobacterium longum]|uniref:Uncharacterized protein n=1 Tax=Methylobacterium longum TaxID=767694 RepID=A0ABT8AUD7_9HYPH|nr:hypothetical protein [Methylobacterium longum]MDN3572954.1 hypothetical protein [Methylobacterium longum]
MLKYWVKDEVLWRCYVAVQIQNIQEGQALIAMIIALGIVILLGAHYQHEVAMGAAVIVLILSGRWFLRAGDAVIKAREVQSLVELELNRRERERLGY